MRTKPPSIGVQPIVKPETQPQVARPDTKQMKELARQILYHFQRKNDAKTAAPPTQNRKQENAGI